MSKLLTEKFHSGTPMASYKHKKKMEDQKWVLKKKKKKTTKVAALKNNQITWLLK